MPESLPEKPTHLLRVVFAVDNVGAHEKVFGWSPKPNVKEMTADGAMWVPDKTGDALNEKHPLHLEIHHAHGGVTVIPRTRILYYETKSQARIKAEAEAFGNRMAAADARLDEEDVRNQRFRG